MAGSRRARRRELTALWAAVVAGGGAAVLAEAMFLSAFLVPAIASTTLLAIGIGVLVTRRINARHREPPITVWDLRRR